MRMYVVVVEEKKSGYMMVAGGILCYDEKLTTVPNDQKWENRWEKEEALG